MVATTRAAIGATHMGPRDLEASETDHQVFATKKHHQSLTSPTASAVKEEMLSILGILTSLARHPASIWGPLHLALATSAPRSTPRSGR